VDKAKYRGEIKLEEIFNFPDYPFKKKWIVKNELSFVDTKEEAEKKKLLEDSLKTHPDCQDRIKLLSTKVQQYRNPNSKKFVVDETEFRKLSKSFDYELLNYEYESGEVSHCLLHTLKMLQGFPGDPYLMGLVGKCLNRLYAAQANHEIGKITDLPNPSYEEEYNSLLRLLQNIRLSELGSITYYYLKSYQAEGIASEEFVAALITSKDNYGKPEEKKEWIEYYKAHFPNRKYNF
jgi:hypothetical protein